MNRPKAVTFNVENLKQSYKICYTHYIYFTKCIAILPSVCKYDWEMLLLITVHKPQEKERDHNGKEDLLVEMKFASCD